ncbi:hypothetical protein E2I00_000755, partial [Balaenoptera physalus]
EKLLVFESAWKKEKDIVSKEIEKLHCAVEPLKAELAELEQLVRDQQDKICAVKASILKNEEKIQKMVHSINLSSRR